MPTKKDIQCATNRLFAILAAAFASLAAVSTVGHAGDLAPPPLPLPPAPVLDTPCCGTEPGWYLRGDIGVGANVVGKHSIDYSPVTNTAPGVVGYNDDLGSSFSGGVGVGYALNSWLRFDGTVEYRGGGKLSSVDFINGNGFVGKDFYSANVSSIVGLANAYVDLGTWYCLTPYIGGGVGVAYNKISGFTDQGYFNGFGPSGTYYKSGDSTNFAWALMAGVAYDVSSNLKLDLGYRYLNYGSVKTGSSVLQLPPTPASTYYRYTQKDLESHDFRVGLRWVFADKSAPPPPPYGHAPIVRKY